VLFGLKRKWNVQEDFEITEEAMQQILVEFVEFS